MSNYYKCNSAISSLDRDIENLVKVLKKLPKEIRGKQKEILEAGAPFIIQKARAKAPKARKPVKRYGTPKLLTSLRAPKGRGKVVATYYPGNLARAIQKLNFKRSNSVWVGYKLRKRGKATGHFRGRKVDPFYAHMIEFGSVNHKATPIMRPAALESQAQVAKAVEKGFRKLMKDFEMKHKK